MSMGEPINILTLNRQWVLESIQSQFEILNFNFGNQE